MPAAFYRALLFFYLPQKSGPYHVHSLLTSTTLSHLFPFLPSFSSYPHTSFPSLPPKSLYFPLFFLITFLSPSYSPNSLSLSLPPSPLLLSLFPMCLWHSPFFLQLSLLSCLSKPLVLSLFYLTFLFFPQAPLSPPTPSPPSFIPALSFLTPQPSVFLSYPPLVCLAPTGSPPPPPLSLYVCVSPAPSCLSAHELPQLQLNQICTCSPDLSS